MSDLTKSRPRRLSWIYRWMMAFVGLFERWLHLSCRSFIRLASERLERPLTFRERIRQVIHRMMCGVCRLHERRMEQLRGLTRELGAASVDASPARLSPAATERMRQAMSEALRRKGTSGAPSDGDGEL